MNRELPVRMVQGQERTQYLVVTTWDNEALEKLPDAEHVSSYKAKCNRLYKKLRFIKELRDYYVFEKIRDNGRIIDSILLNRYAEVAEKLEKLFKESRNKIVEMMSRTLGWIYA